MRCTAFARRRPATRRRTRLSRIRGIAQAWATPNSWESIQAGNVRGRTGVNKEAIGAGGTGLPVWDIFQIPRRRMMSPKFSPDVRASTFFHRAGE
jgi:hypothetical protein